MKEFIIVYIIIGIMFSYGFTTEYYKGDKVPIFIKGVIILLASLTYPILIGASLGQSYRKE